MMVLQVIIQRRQALQRIHCQPMQSLLRLQLLSDPGFELVASPAGGTWSGVGILGSSFFPGRTIPGSYPLTYTLNNATNCVSSASIVAKVEECAERRRLLRDDAVVLFPNPSSGQ